MKQILSGMRKAIEDYKMIEEGDKIAVGLSGGKDSVTLLMALKNLQIFYPKKFEIANLRRGALNDVATRLGCNKIALGHHKDDVIETFFLSLFYEGHIHTFSPVTYLSRRNITSIRPFIYLEEKEIKAFAKRNNIPVMKKTCIVDGNTKREFMKNMILELSKHIPRLKACIFGAIERSNIKGWEKINSKEE